jgi:hypothetical protein
MQASFYYEPNWMNSDVAMLIVLYTVLFLFNLPIDATVSIKDGNIFAGDFIYAVL